MNLTKTDIHKDPSLQKQVKTLYHRSFPKEERIPWWLLLNNSRRKGIDLTAWMDGEVFCGMTASVDVEDLHFVLFLAIAPNMQGKGYGSAILTALQNEYDVVELNVEPLLESAPNYSQRQRRFAFYNKNGLQDTGYHVWEVGGMFRILSTSAVLDVPRYKKVFKKLTWGLWDVRVEKAE